MWTWHALCNILVPQDQIIRISYLCITKACFWNETVTLGALIITIMKWKEEENAECCWSVALTLMPQASELRVVQASTTFRQREREDYTSRATGIKYRKGGHEAGGACWPLIGWSVHKQTTVPCSGVLPHEQHTDGHRPGFDRHDFSPDREVLSNVDGPVDHVVPHGRVVRAVHNIDLYFHGSGQGRVAFVLGRGFQLVRFSLSTRGNISRVVLVMDIRAGWQVDRLLEGIRSDTRSRFSLRDPPPTRLRVSQRRCSTSIPTWLLRKSLLYPLWHFLWCEWGRTYSCPRVAAYCSCLRRLIQRPRPHRRAARLCPRPAHAGGTCLAKYGHGQVRAHGRNQTEHTQSNVMWTKRNNSITQQKWTKSNGRYWAPPPGDTRACLSDIREYPSSVNMSLADYILKLIFSSRQWKRRQHQLRRFYVLYTYLLDNIPVAVGSGYAEEQKGAIK